MKTAAVLRGLFLLGVLAFLGCDSGQVIPDLKDKDGDSTIAPSEVAFHFTAGNAVEIIWSNPEDISIESYTLRLLDPAGTAVKEETVADDKVMNRDGFLSYVLTGLELEPDTEYKAEVSLKAKDKSSTPVVSSPLRTGALVPAVSNVGITFSPQEVLVTWEDPEDTAAISRYVIQLTSLTGNLAKELSFPPEDAGTQAGGRRTYTINYDDAGIDVNQVQLVRVLIENSQEERSLPIEPVRDRIAVSLETPPSKVIADQVSHHYEEQTLFITWTSVTPGLSEEGTAVLPHYEVYLSTSEPGSPEELVVPANLQPDTDRTDTVITLAERDPSDTYYLVIKAANDGENQSGSSLSNLVVIRGMNDQTSDPGQATEIKHLYRDDKIYVSWTEATPGTDAEGNILPVFYSVYLSTSDPSYPEDLVTPENLQSDSSPNSVPNNDHIEIEGLDFTLTYYLVVKAVSTDDSIHRSSLSEVYTIEGVVNDLSSPPGKVDINGLLHSYNTEKTKLTLRWGTVTLGTVVDGTSDFITQFNVYLTSDAAGASMTSAEIAVPENKVVENLVGYETVIENLNPYQAHYLVIESLNFSNALSNLSDVAATTAQTRPQGLLLMSPVDNAEEVSFTNLKFIWSYGAAASGGSYELYIKDSQGADAVPPVTGIEQVSDASAVIPLLPPGADYTWQIVVKDDTGAELLQSPTSSFSTKNMIISPDNGAEEITRHPLIEFREIPGVDSYSIYRLDGDGVLGDSPLFDNITGSPFRMTKLNLGETYRLKIQVDGIFSEELSITINDSYNNDDAQFLTIGDHSYEIVTSEKNWFDAGGAARSNGGSLVEINSAQEQSALFTYLSENNISSSSVTDGGGSQYIWIGASDRIVEGGWSWFGSSSISPVFWRGGTDGQAIDNAYTNWGSKNSKEPDNYLSNQDAAAIGLTSWPNGNAGEWNDLNEANTIPFIIEYEFVID